MPSEPTNARRTRAVAGGGSLARGGVALGVATALANALGYAFTVAITRSFGAAEYGALGALLGAALIGAIPGGAVQYVLARRTAAAGLRAGQNERAGLWLAVAVGAALAVAVAALSPVAARFFHLDGGWPVLWLAASLVPYTVCGALMGGLLGHERYTAFGVAEVVLAAARFVAGIVIALAGFGVTGAMAALAVGTAAASGLLWWISGPRSWRARVPVDVPRLVGDLARACSAIAGIAVLSNLDLLYARHYLPRAASGPYALASLFAKACLWGAQFVSMAVFPRLARGGPQGALLVRSALVTAAIGGIGVLGAAVAGRPVVEAVAGHRGGYAAAVPLVVPFALLGTLWALVQLALLAAVATGDPRPGRLLWAAVAAEGLVIAAAPHRTGGQILAACLAVTSLLVVGGVLLDLRGRAPSRSSRRSAGPDSVSARRPQPAPVVARGE